MSVCKLLDLDISSLCIDVLIKFAIKAAVESQCLPDCAPVIMQFLAGKTMSFSVSPLNMSSSESKLMFIEKYPQCISLFRSVNFNFYNTNMKDKALDLSGLTNAYGSYGIPTVDEDYSSAYLPFNKIIQDNEQNVNESNQMFSLFPQEIQIDDSLIRPFISGHKTPLFRIQVKNVNSENFSQTKSEKIQMLFLMSDHIEMHLIDCKGFVKSIGSAIDQFSGSFKKLIIHNTSLEEEEQDMILKMSSLESLEIENVKSNYPDKFIQSFADLEVLHLNFKKLVDCNGLINSLTTCKTLKELNLCGTPLLDSDMALLASAMMNFTRLKILNLKGQKITAKDISETFAVALGSLLHLEKLWLPVGDGMAHAAKLIIKQLQNLPELRLLTMVEILDDESITLLAEQANNGNLKKLQQLELQVNANITESGWTTFFEQAKHMPDLQHLDMSRMYTQQIKSHATTVTSFVRFVSRLPSLMTLIMYGWLLDKDDLDMFNAMKENHPQAKSLNIFWQWVLPFSPTIEH